MVVLFQNSGSLLSHAVDNGSSAKQTFRPSKAWYPVQLLFRRAPSWEHVLRLRNNQARCLGAPKERFGNEGSHLDTVLTESTPCLCINRTIFSTEVVEHPGVIIVKGDVNSGAVIRADGDIVIWGNVEGEVHAGKCGDRQAMVFGLQLTPTALSIAGYVAPEPVGDDGSHYCEVATLSSDGKIRIQKAVDQSFKGLLAVHGDDNAAKAPILGVIKDGKKAWFGFDVKSMRRPSQVAFLTGAYIFTVGVALLLFPERLFGIFFDLKSVGRLWIQVGAIIAVVFGIYYIGTAFGDAKGCNGADSFYMSTVIGRIFLLVGRFTCCSPPPFHCWCCEFGWCSDDVEGLTNSTNLMTNA